MKEKKKTIFSFLSRTSFVYMIKGVDTNDKGNANKKKNSI